jgi:hypothetical protein
MFGVQRTVVVILAVWLVAAIAVGASGILSRLPVPPPLMAVALAIALLLLVRQSRRARAAVSSLGPRPLVLFHLTRIAAGAYFLLLYSRGVLPGEFAIAAGWGDIAVGVAALAVALTCVPMRTRRQQIGLLLWNTAGLIDILGVLGNGMRLFAGSPAIGQPFTALPLALLPTFVVPIVIVSHVLLYGYRFGRPGGRAGAATSRQP